MSDSKLILNAALTGTQPTRAETPFVPITPEEIAASASRVASLGVSVVHLHARDDAGRPTHAREVYEQIVLAVREAAPELVITVSTSGRVTSDIEERLDVLRLEGDAAPDMASLTLGSMNFIRDASATPPGDIRRLIDEMGARGVRPELEVFDLGMAHYAAHLFDKGVLEGPHYTNLILGSLGTAPATPRSLVHLVDELPGECVWGATGVGGYAFEVQRLALAMGGHVRVGVEDSIALERGGEPVTNEQLVGRVRRVADAMGREIMTPAEVRRLLGLERR